MATRIRLRRMGAKKAPFYRVVVADSRSPRDGRFIEEIGYYDPTKNPSIIKIDEERAKYWMGTGAQPSETVKTLMARVGIIEEPVYKTTPETKAAVAVEAADPQPAAEAAAAVAVEAEVVAEAEVVEVAAEAEVAEVEEAAAPEAADEAVEAATLDLPEVADEEPETEAEAETTEAD